MRSVNLWLEPSPYGPRLVAHSPPCDGFDRLALSLGGRRLRNQRRSHRWSFSPSQEDAVRQALTRVFGTDGSTPDPDVVLRWRLGHRTNPSPVLNARHLWTVDWAREAVWTHEGVFVLSGGFVFDHDPWSGQRIVRSVRGTVLEIHHVPRSIAQALVWDSGYHEIVEGVDPHRAYRALHERAEVLRDQLREVEEQLPAEDPGRGALLERMQTLRVEQGGEETPVDVPAEWRVDIRGEGAFWRAAFYEEEGATAALCTVRERKKGTIEVQIGKRRVRSGTKDRAEAIRWAMERLTDSEST